MSKEPQKEKPNPITEKLLREIIEEWQPTNADWVNLTANLNERMERMEEKIDSILKELKIKKKFRELDQDKTNDQMEQITLEVPV